MSSGSIGVSAAIRMTQNITDLRKALSMFVQDEGNYFLQNILLEACRISLSEQHLKPIHPLITRIIHGITKIAMLVERLDRTGDDVMTDKSSEIR